MGFSIFHSSKVTMKESSREIQRTDVLTREELEAQQEDLRQRGHRLHGVMENYEEATAPRTRRRGR